MQKAIITMKDLKQISCDPLCGFMIRSHNEKEVVEHAKMHVKHSHPSMKMNDDQIKSMVKSV